MGSFRRYVQKVRTISLAIVIVVWQVFFAAMPLLQSQVAHAAQQCITDTAGPNDEPGQKDLNSLCRDDAPVSGTESVTWNWDETGTSGANTLDGCALFDTDGDGNINYSVCVTTTGDPATLQSTTIYSCGDAKIDRCTSPAIALPTPYDTVCGVSQSTDDPFPGPASAAKGASYPNDTKATCTLALSDVGGSAAKLVDVCSYPSAQPNSDPSDCVIIRNDFGKVEVVKDLIPGTDPGLFNLSINGPDANDTTTVNNVGDGGTTGEVVVKKGSVVVSETAGTNTALTSYNTSIICKDQNGTGTTLATGTPTGTTSRQLTFTLEEAADVVCTITNTRQSATLILQKTVVNDNGGTLTQSSFPVFIDSTAVAWGNNTVSPGTYTVSETTQSGYQPGSWGGDCTAGGSVTLTDGQTKTCTITNDDIPATVTLVKTVTNDNGGNAVANDFQAKVDGNNVSWSTSVQVNAGSHTASETNLTGYTAGDWGGDCAANGTFTAQLGGSYTCTITNDDVAPQLTIVKNVINDNGGTATADDFVLRLNGNALSSPTMSNSNATATYTVSSVVSNTAYTVTEDASTTYDDGNGVSCTDDDTAQAVSHPVTLNEGQHVTCTITNDDIAPTLQLIKSVINDNGGDISATNWVLTATVSGTTTTLINEAGTTSDGGATAETGTATATAGVTYVLSESGPAGYTSGLWSCDGGSLTGSNLFLSLAETVTCTITNNDNAPSLTLVKQVINDNGGQRTASEWTLTATGSVQNPTNLSGSGGATSGSDFKADTYTLAETGPIDYTTGTWSCTNDVTVNGNNQISLANGQSTTCTITNDDIPATVTLVKTVTNDNGGNAVANDFQAKVDGNNVSWSTSVQVNAGSHTASETNLTGYTAGDWGGDCAANGTFTAQLGGSYTCTITNDDVAPQLTIVKNVINDNGGQRTASEWTLTATGTSQSPTNLSGAGGATSGSNFKADTYTLAETGPTDYTAGTWSCTNDFTINSSNQITLANGQSTTCTITNDDIAPTITVEKQTLPDGDDTSFRFTANNGLLSGNDVNFSLSDDEISDAIHALSAGSVTISEVVPDDWQLIDVDCGDIQSVVTGNSVTFRASLAATIHCVFTNEKKASIAVTKYNDRNQNGVRDVATEEVLSDWEITVNDNKQKTGSDGTAIFNGLKPGDGYFVGETLQTGWNFSAISCSGTGEQAAVTSREKSDKPGMTVTPVAGEAITCTIGNFQPAPQVLGESVVLVNTGQGNINRDMLIGFVLLGAVLLISRRRADRR